MRRHLNLSTWVRAVAVVLTAIWLGGCVVEDNDNVLDLGSVSIGQQLIDLEEARDTGAMSAAEYEHVRTELIEAIDEFSDDNDDDDDDHHKNKERHNDPTRNQDNEDDDDDDGWLF